MIGAQIGAYRILQQIGQGGMGAVYLAEHAMLGRQAAIKVLHPSFSTRPEIVARFFNEARAATAIADPGIVQIFDFGHAADGTAYIVMELLVGEPLDQRLHRIGSMPIPDALRIMRQVAASIGAAHARGITHRDLKPDNIYLCRDPEVPGGERAKILDFGIAKLAADQGGVRTQTSAVIGTPAFMSPEQCRGAGLVDQRSDVYSLGCVLAKLLTGSPPFEAEGTGDLIVMHLREPAQAPSLRAHGIPRELDELVLRCLEKDPSRRFSSGTELAYAIEALAARPSYGHYTPAPAVSVPSQPGTPTTLSSAAGYTPYSSGSVVPASSRLGKFVALGALVGIAAVVAIVIATRGPSGDAASSKAPAVPAGGAVAAVEPPRVPATVPAPVAQTVDARPANARQQIAAVLTAFKDWTRAHPSDPCPSIEALAKGSALAIDDPWGTRLALTCSDQPADQIAGVQSAGPDKQRGTADDLESWALGAEVTAVVRGPRWAPKPAVAVAPVTGSTSAPIGRPVHKHPPAAGGAATPDNPNNAGFVDVDGDGIPDKR